MKIRTKIILGMSVLAGLPLGSFGYFSIENFKDDKMAYVFTSNSEILSGRAAIVRRILGEQERTISDLTKKILALGSNKSEQDLPENFIYFSSMKNSVDQSRVELSRNHDAEKRKVLAKSCELLSIPFCVRIVNNNSDDVFLSLSRKNLAGDIYKIEAIIKSSELAVALSPADSFSAQLLHESEIDSWLNDEAIEAAPIKEAVANHAQNSSVVVSEKLVSFSSIGQDDLYLLSLRPLGESLAIIHKMTIQSLLYLLAAVSSVLILAVLLTARLTAGLDKIVDITKEISGGNFKSRVPVKGNDEVASLGLSVNTMSQKIEELMLETAEKARMENELATAQAIQSTLYPDSVYQADHIHIRGIYLTASECGGDFWYYYEDSNNFFVFMGDVIGHGVPAALMTASARATITLMSSQGEQSVAKILSRLNEAIYQGSRGKMHMSFLAGRIDKRTGVFTYSNASHNPAYILRLDESGKTNRRAIEVLTESISSTLGAQEKLVCTESSVQLTKNDILVLYTDGFPEATNADQTMWSSGFDRTLVKAWNASGNLESMLLNFSDDFEKFVQKSPIHDDAMLSVVQWNP